jgi:hypothetical protein
MPKIKVESKDTTQRHLRMVLDGINGKIKLPLTSKSSLDQYSSNPMPPPSKAITGRNNLVGAALIEGRFKSNKVSNYTSNEQTYVLPNISFKDKRKED